MKTEETENQIEKPDKEKKRFSDTLFALANGEFLRSVTFSKFPSDGEITKIKGRPALLGKRRVIRFEYSLTEGRVRQENVELSDIADFTMRAFSLGTRMADINAVGTSATLMISSKGKETFLCKNSGNGSGIKKDGDDAPQRESAPPLDREKKKAPQRRRGIFKGARRL